MRLTGGNVHDTTMFAALLAALRVARPGVHVEAGGPGPLELPGVGEVGQQDGAVEGLAAVLAGWHLADAQPDEGPMINRFLRAVAVAAAASIALIGLSSGAAAAHTDLETSAPSDGEVLAVAPQAITLTFAEAVQPRVVQVAVTGPGGQLVNSGAAVIDGRVVRQQVGVGADGAYVVAYRVVSSDGRPVSDQIAFTYPGPGFEAVEPSATGSTGPPPGAASRDADSASGLALWWPFIVEVAVITALALALQLLVLLVLRRRGR